MDSVFTIKDEDGLELWVTQDDVESQSIMGGDDSNPTWENYVMGYRVQFRPHIQLLRKAIEEMGWIGRTGRDVSNYYTFVFSNGTVWGFSWRAWGDLMQAIVNKQEGYMAYYM